jgi:hypothetical protein
VVDGPTPPRKMPLKSHRIDDGGGKERGLVAGASGHQTPSDATGTPTVEVDMKNISRMR